VVRPSATPSCLVAAACDSLERLLQVCREQQTGESDRRISRSTNQSNKSDSRYAMTDCVSTVIQSAVRLISSFEPRCARHRRKRRPAHDIGSPTIINRFCFASAGALGQYIQETVQGNFSGVIEEADTRPFTVYFASKWQYQPWGQPRARYPVISTVYVYIALSALL
jgi:hypothetical protein